jgi:hypothetical protein
LTRIPRRAIVMSFVESIEVTVRSGRVGGYGPVLPLGSSDDVEQFFAGRSWRTRDDCAGRRVGGLGSQLAHLRQVVLLVASR